MITKITIKARSKIVLEQLLSTQIRPQLIIIVKRQSEETTSPNQDNLPPRYNGWVIKPPVCYREIGEVKVVVSDNKQDDPLTYQHVMEDPNKEK